MRVYPCLHSKVTLLCLTTLISSLVCFHCSTKSNPWVPIYIDQGTFILGEEVCFDPNDFQTCLDNTGALRQGVFYDSCDDVGVIFIAGLWLGGYLQGQPSADIIWAGSTPASNFTAIWGENSVGVYHVDLTGILNNEQDWPVEHGAPVDALGEPVCYGDAMCWSSLQGDTTHSVSILYRPITGEETKFAFTGDPIERTGWLDTPVDVRSMIASGPFSLGAGERQIISVAWAVESGQTLMHAIHALKGKIVQVRNENQLWFF